MVMWDTKARVRKVPRPPRTRCPERRRLLYTGLCRIPPATHPGHLLGRLKASTEDRSRTDQMVAHGQVKGRPRGGAQQHSHRPGLTCTRSLRTSHQPDSHPRPRCARSDQAGQEINR